VRRRWRDSTDILFKSHRNCDTRTKDISHCTLQSAKLCGKSAARGRRHLDYIPVIYQINKKKCNLRGYEYQARQNSRQAPISNKLCLQYCNLTTPRLFVRLLPSAEYFFFPDCHLQFSSSSIVIRCTGVRKQGCAGTVLSDFVEQNC
jgi:hypothetical protein